MAIRVSSWQADPFHAQAMKLTAHYREAIPLTLLGELELINGVRRTFAVKAIDQQEPDAIFRQIADDEASGILVRHAVDQAEHYAKARELSKKFTPTIPARSLDILHVAAALLLKPAKFASFDDRQRMLAHKAGLAVVPKIVVRRKPR
jgi:hypothetical protein